MQMALMEWSRVMSPIRCSESCGVFQRFREDLESQVIEHAHYKEAKAKLELALRGKRNLIFLVGPTGSGKSVLARRLVEEQNRLVESDPWSLRAVAIRTPSPFAHVFSWESLLVNLLEALHDPLPDEKVDREDMVAAVSRRVGFSIARSSRNKLAKAVLSSVKDRKVRLICVDEAMNFAVNESGVKFESRLRVLRDLSDGVSGHGVGRQEENCKIMLVSTPSAMAEIMSASSEIVRRTQVVKLSRYDGRGGSRSKEVKEFQRLVQRFVGYLPESYRPTLTLENILTLLRESVGCIGNVANWSVDAVNVCEREGATKLDWGHFVEAALPNTPLREMAKQCTLDEKICEDLTVMSGCGDRLKPVQKEAERVGDKKAVGPVTAGNAEKKKGRRRVGKQKPARLKMGVS